MRCFHSYSSGLGAVVGILKVGHKKLFLLVNKIIIIVYITVYYTKYAISYYFGIYCKCICC